MLIGESGGPIGKAFIRVDDTIMETMANILFQLNITFRPVLVIQLEKILHL